MRTWNIVFLALLSCGCVSTGSRMPKDVFTNVEGVLIEKAKQPSWAETKPFASTRAECRYRGDDGMFVERNRFAE